MGEKLLDPDGDLSDAEIYRLQSQSMAAELFDLAVASDAPRLPAGEGEMGRE